jgi:PAS domain S-box-containing protein
VTANHKLWSDTDAPTQASFLAAIIDHVAHPIFVKDRTHQFVLVNRALSQMVGVPEAALLGKTDHDFFPREQADFFLLKDQEVLDQGHEVFIEQEPLTDMQGGRHILTTTKMPLRDSSGTVTHVVGIIHDITRLKEAEEALRLSNEQLDRRVQERTVELAAAQAELVRKERLAVLGQLAGGLAHQIRNPLGAIVNAASLLQRTVGEGTSPQAREALRMLHEEAWRANRIITDLIDYARVRPPARSRVDVRELLEQSVRAQQLPQNIEIRWDLPDPLLHIAIDSEQVLGALGNLIRNAAEAMPGGGTLTLGARRTGEQLCISVHDTGPGLRDEVKERLFQPLVTSKALGLGLGLPTARALVENQGGTLSCLRSDGRGTLFEVLLPF